MCTKMASSAFLGHVECLYTVEVMDIQVTMAISHEDILTVAFKKKKE